MVCLLFGNGDIGKPRKYPRQAWPGMIDILRKQKATPSVARDAAPVGRMSGSFAGLSNITIAE